MSKKSKKANKIKRLAEKRARRAANQAKYEAWRVAGKNNKSKRYIKASKNRLVGVYTHPEIPCGNPACKRCYSN